jgi:phosphomethylpyrimidine synthase
MAKTIIEEVREGRVPDEVRAVARREGVDEHKLTKRIASGRAILIRNVKLPNKVSAIGLGLTTKVNVNIGTSSEVINLETELEKVRIANRWGDTLMDLSTGGDLDEIRRAIIRESKLPVGTVPTYQAFIDSFRRKGGGAYFSEDELFKAVERHLRDGVAFMTIRGRNEGISDQGP